MLAGLLNTTIFVFSFLLVLSFLVFIHELGHYSVARFFKVSVEKFSIGFGKPIWTRTAKSGTQWSISRIPLGGYVKFRGDAGAASNPDAAQLEAIKAEVERDGNVRVEDIFHFKPLYQRVLVVLAGPVANFLLAIVIFALFAMLIGTRSFEPLVGKVDADTPAAAAGFLPGDKITALDGSATNSFSDLQRYVALRGDTQIDVTVLRDGREVPLTVRPARVETKDFVGGKAKMGRIGLYLSPEAEQFDAKYNPVSALGFGAKQTAAIIGTTGTYIGRIFTGKESGDQLGSVVRIAAITGKTAVDTANADITFGQKVKVMLRRLFLLAASISIGLGFANLMPIPVLDGGHLLYYGYEAVAGRPLSQKKQEFGFRVGFALLLTLFLVLTINDIGYVSSIFS